MIVFSFFTTTATTEIYTLSLHDALPISGAKAAPEKPEGLDVGRVALRHGQDRPGPRSEEHTSELQSQSNLVCRLLLEKKKNQQQITSTAHPARGRLSSQLPHARRECVSL